MEQVIARNPTAPLVVPGAFLVYLLIFVSPFSVYSLSLPGGVGLTPINTLSILFFPLMAVICLMRSSLPQITAVGILHFLFIFICLSGVIFADNQMAAARGAGGYLIEYVFCFLYVVFFLKTREQVETAVRLFVLAGLFNAVMGWTQLLGFFLFGEAITPPFAEIFRGPVSLKNFGYGSGAFSIPGFMRMQGFIGDGFGSWMLIPTGLAVYGALKYKSRLFKAAVGFFLLTLLLSASRSSYVGILAFSFLIYFLYRSDRRRLFPLVFKSYKILLVFAAILLFFYATKDSTIFDRAEIQLSATTKIKTPVFLLKRLNPFVYGSRSASLSYFSDHLKLAALHSTDNLGFGRGSQNFDDFVYDKYRVKYGSHSNFIIFLGDNGIWGFLTQVLIVLFIVLQGLRTYFRQPRESIDHLPLFLTATYVAMVLTGVVRTFYLLPETFIVGGMIARLYLLNRPREALR
jgi:hypothetical protein